MEKENLQLRMKILELQSQVNNQANQLMAFEHQNLAKKLATMATPGTHEMEEIQDASK